MDAKRHKPPRGHEGRNTLPALRTKTRLGYWATPRASLVTAAQVMTQRTAHDLQTQIRNEIDTPDEERACAVNPEFVEWLMGYPRGWTAAAVS